MADLLLQQRYRATDGTSASTAVQAVFGVGTVSHDDDTPFEYVQQSLVDDGISATRIESSGSAVRIHALAAPDLVVLTVREGRLEVRQEAGAASLEQGDIGLIPLGSAAELRWDRVSIDAYSFPPAAVGRLLGSNAQQLQLDCARLTPRSPALASLWHRTAGTLSSEVLQKRELFDSDLIREQAIDALLAVAIEAFGISAVREGDTTSDQAVLTRAEAFMRRHLADPITMPDVARAVGMSLRGLQVTFQRVGRGTPLLHLRELRMAAAHDALAAPGASRTTTVGAVARRLGYSNPGRFSAHYRAAFGESPAETLRAPREAT